MEQPESRAPGGGVPFFFWLATCVAIGAGVGYLAPWDGGVPLRQSRSVDRLVGELADPATRTAAYMRLKERGSEAVPALLAAAKDPAYPARSEAVELLGRLEAQEARAFLLELAEPELADERVVALGRLGGAEALREVLATLERPELELHFPALNALIRWREPLPAEVPGRVLPYLSHAEWGLRELAAKFMGTHRHAPALQPLIALLEDPQAPVRQAAAWALMQLGDPDGQAAVQRALERGAVVFEE